jgi:hypothetical protein
VRPLHDSAHAGVRVHKGFWQQFKSLTFASDTSEHNMWDMMDTLSGGQQPKFVTVEGAHGGLLQVQGEPKNKI